MMGISNYKLAALLPAIFLLQACVVAQPPVPDDPEWAPVVATTPKVNPASVGGLYAAGGSISLFSDRRAHGVGDILTVILSEQTTANKLAETEITKENTVDILNPTLLGKTPNDILGTGTNLANSISADRDFSGEAESDQRNSLSGSIAVTVTDVLPNGLLVVRGEKWITLNSGEEFIRIRGLVRPDDVSPDNTLLSTRLADARIAYSGTGDFANSNRQGWFSRFLNSEIWPF